MLWTFALLVMFCRTVEAGAVKLAWDVNLDPTVTGYVLYYGVTPGTYSTTVDVGNVTAWTQAGLTDGQQYYFAVAAYNGTGVVSSPSNEVTTTLPPLTVPDLTVAASHVGNFSQGQVGAV
jgi:hypothetical protein